MAIRLLRAMSIDGRQYGHMDLVLGLSAAQEESLVRGGDATLVANLGMPPALGLVQAEVASLASVAAANLAAQQQGLCEALLWWPLYENLAASGSTPTISDVSGQLQGVYVGGSRRWGPWPGLAFDAGAYLPMNAGALAGLTSAAKLCGNLASLQTGKDQITVWAVVAHPAPITGGTDRTILSFGATQHAKGGWSVGLGGSRERCYMTLAPQGVTDISKCRTEFDGDKLTGSTINPTPSILNTLTAVAFELMADTAGYLVANAFYLPVNVDFGIDLKLQGWNSLPLVPPGSGGTAPATDDVACGFTIGARPTTGQEVVADSATALSLLQVGVARHQFDPSLGQRVVRELRAAPKALPRSMARQLALSVGA